MPLTTPWPRQADRCRVRPAPISLKSGQLASQRELAEAVGIQGATLTHHLNAMESAGPGDPAPRPGEPPPAPSRS